MDKTYRALCTKLLDTGKRNKLINFHSSMRSIEVLNPKCDILFDTLMDGTKLVVYNVDKDLDDIKNEYGELNSRNVNEYLIKDIKKNQCLLFNEDYKCEATLRNISRITKSVLKEQGINVLYLAVGYLVWMDKKKQEELSSPLILVPIKIENDKNKYSISLFEEDYDTNPSLVYKLKNEFNIDLPIFRNSESESLKILDENIDTYLFRVSEAVAKKGWTVLKESHIGIFSYLKINMYEDLINHEKEALSNPLVNKLIGKDVELDNGFETDIDKFFKEGSDIDIHNVVDADSSQMEAILRSTEGKSFVIQGPPGTGKSQTITNIIAENIYRGRKVLFVSEKLAALEVVYHNLEKVGLAKYCLELHSNKTNKKEVLADLKNILSSPKESLSDAADNKLKALREEKEILDAYANRVNLKVQPLNKTLYDCLSEIAKVKEYNNFDYPIKNVEAKDQSYFDKAIKAIKSFINFSSSIGYDYHKNTWYSLKLRQLDYEDKITIKDNLQIFYSYLDKLKIYLDILNSDLKFKLDSFKKIEDLYQFILAISKLSVIKPDLFNKEYLRSILKKLHDYNDKQASYDESYKIMGEHYRINIYENDLCKLYNNFTTKYNTFFRFLKKSYKEDVKLLKTYQKDLKHKYKYDKLVLILKEGSNKQILQHELVEAKKNLVDELDLRDNKEYNFIKIEQELQALYDAFPLNYKSLQNSNVKELKEIKNRITEFIHFYQDTKEERDLKEKIKELFDSKTINVDTDLFKAVNNFIGKCLDDFESIDNYVNFNNLLDELVVLDLINFIDKSIDKDLERSTLDKTYTYLFYVQWAYYIINHDKVLKNFARASHDETVKEFKINDNLKKNIDKAIVSSTLQNRLPDIQTVIRGSQLSDILKEANKKSRVKPVRLLLKDDGLAIQEIKPCFLMSPLSISTFIESDSIKFDVVIFDEASQVFPEDAIGAIYRSNQVIVVGDSKQMPPTNFFNATYSDDEYDEDDYDTTGGFESILDLSSSILPSTTLNWHYRSNSEELIAFSNKYFYSSRLSTFPEAKTNVEGMGTKLVYVSNGIFDRKKKQNLEEANRVVEVFFDEIKKYPKRSIGVVAFSLAQAELIDELIDEFKARNRKYNSYFSDEEVEPYFVKNLETVQGDERDTIIFSTAYAKDLSGRFLNNFGPLNKDGGERRLNVAVTRAKDQLIVVTSMHSIDISSELSYGGKILKEYLAYVERNEDLTLPIEEALVKEDEYVNDIYNELVDAGFNVVKHVGKSNFKIDLAIKDDNDDYKVAIELDGTNYYNGRSTSDRDRLRENMLAKYGWAYYRIWTVEWFKNHDIEKRKLINFIKKSLNKEVQVVESRKLNESFLDIEKEKRKEPVGSFDESVEIIFDKYTPYNINKNGLVTNELYNLISKEGPIVFDLICDKCLELFRRRQADDEYKKIVRTYLKKDSEKIFKVEDYYVTDKNKEIKMRIPRKESEARDVSQISLAELASGAYLFVKNNVSIDKNNLYQALAKNLGYPRSNTMIEERFDEVIDYLVRKDKVVVKENMITIK